MDTNARSEQEAEEHARQVFARMSARHRVPPARRLTTSPKANTKPVPTRTYQAGQDKALPPEKD